MPRPSPNRAQTRYAGSFETAPARKLPSITSRPVQETAVRAGDGVRGALLGAPIHRHRQHTVELRQRETARLPVTPTGGRSDGATHTPQRGPAPQGSWTAGRPRRRKVTGTRGTAREPPRDPGTVTMGQLRGTYRRIWTPLVAVRTTRLNSRNVQFGTHPDRVRSGGRRASRRSRPLAAPQRNRRNAPRPVRRRDRVRLLTRLRLPRR